MLTGRLVDWRTGDATTDDPAYGAAWDAQRTVPGALLAELLAVATGPHRPRALRLAGARIVGRLDLEAAELVCPLLLRGCWFAGPVVLRRRGRWRCGCPAAICQGCRPTS